MKRRNDGRLLSNFQESGIAKRRRGFLLLIDSLSDEDMTNKILDAIDYFTDAYRMNYPEVLICTCRDMATDYVQARVVEILKAAPAEKATTK